MQETIYAVDLFAGAGGTSTGLAYACLELGKNIELVAINHWKIAIESHAANHPWAKHICANVESLNPREIVPKRHLNILVASPECFPSGTLILAERGLVPIEEVIIGDRVLTHQGRWQPVTATMTSIRDTIVVKGQGHYGLEVTANHSFYARKCVMVIIPANDYHEGRSFEQPSWIGARELISVGAHWATPTRAEPLGIPEVGGRGMDFSTDFWSLVGFWLEEGIVRLRKTNSEITLSCGAHEADLVRARLKKFAPPSTVKRCKRNQLRWRQRRTRTAVLFETAHQGLAMWLVENFGRHAHGKTIPAWALAMKREWRAALVDGYLQADGYPDGNGRQDATTVSKRLAIGMRLLAESLGFSVNMALVQRDPHKIEGRRINSRPAYRLYWVVERALDHLYGLRDSSHEWARVKEIKEGRKAIQVYNLSVKEDESYVADGLVVHNCTHFSRAAGGRPKQDQKRSSAWQILRWLELLKVDSLLVENVIEFSQWGPITNRGIPIKSRKGEIYQSWLSAIRSFGYNVDTNVLNAADYGAPTSRSRLFIVAKKGNVPIKWPEPTHDKNGRGKQKWRPAREIIDWSIKGESIFARKRPLSRRTIGRIIEGLKRFGGRELQPFIVLMEHGGGVRSIDEPLPTITTVKGGSMAFVEPFVLSQASGGAPRSVGQPLPTIPAGGAHALIEPFVLSQGSNGAPRSVEDPLPTIVTGGKHALIESFIIPFFGERDGQTPRNHSISEPLPAVTSHGAGALVEPFLLPVRGFFGRNTPKSVDEPLGTITQRGYGGLVEPCIVQYNGNSGARSINDPLPTIPTHDRFGLVQPEISGHYLDVRFRMLQPHELAGAMGFPRGYKLSGTKTEVIRQIGNGVVVQVAKALCCSLLGKEKTHSLFDPVDA